MEIKQGNNQKKHRDISQNEFLTEVGEASKKLLVIVDFWAPWCGPCKDLGPRIEKIVSQANDKVTLVKINIDENQELAAQLQIQSIPTVLAFKKGKIANAFQGSLPENEIIKFIEQALGEKLESNNAEKIKEAREYSNKEMYEESNIIIEEIIGSNANGQNNEAIELLIKNNISLGKLDNANEIIQSLEDDAKKDPNIISAINAYDLANNSSNESLNELIDAVKNYPLNIENNKKLSDYYFNNKQYDEAFSLILDLFVKIKKEKRSDLKKILINYFNVLGDTHEKTIAARRKLSSIIFS